MSQPIKLIAFDLDGTVLKPDLSISPRVHCFIRFLQQLAAHGANVVAVGDPDQAIYGFRGADADGLLRFDEVFAQPSCTTIALETTRRFGPQLADVATRVVPRNALGSVGVQQTQRHRRPTPAGPAGKATFRVYESEAAQADHIADLLRRVYAGSSEVFDVQLDWSQMAVLVRSGSRDLPSLQRALTAAGIPVQVPQDDIPVARMPAVRPLLDVLKAAAGADGGLVDPPGAGSVQANTLVYNQFPVNTTFFGGIDLRLLATANQDYLFDSWSAGNHAFADSSINLVNLNLTAPDTIIAHFKLTTAAHEPGKPGAAPTLAVYPSLFSRETTLDYFLPENAQVSVTLHSLSGNWAKSIITPGNVQTEGRHYLKIDFDELRLPAGMYLLHFSTGEFEKTIKLVRAE